MKILVTGATGYIGRDLIPELLTRGHSVRILIRKESHLDNIKNIDQIELFQGDLTKEETLHGIVDGVDYVYHLAAYLGYRTKTDTRFSEVNHIGSINLLKQCIGKPIKNFLFTTSTGAMGPIAKKDISEEDFSPPVTEYGQSKYEAECAIKSFAAQHNISCVIVRLTHVYGPGEKRDLFRIIKMVKSGVFPQIGFSPNLYPAVYIDDAIQGLIKAAEKGRNGETYNITDKQSHDTKKMRMIIKQLLGIKNPFYPVLPKTLMLAICFITDWVTEKTGIKFPVTKKNIDFMTAARQFSIEKAKKELSYMPQIDLEEGLKRTIISYKEEGLL